MSLDPTVFAEAEGSLTVMIEGGAVSGPELDQALTLVGVNSYNFGHWLVEFLPKVWGCMGRSDFSSVPILLDEQMHPALRPMLQMFIGKDHPIHVLKRGEAVRVRRLWACSSVTYFPFSGGATTPDLMNIDGPAFAKLIGGLSTHLAVVDGVEGPSRIFFTRNDSQHRRLVNRTEVEAFFVSHGFHVVDPGDLPFVEQLRLVRGANVVVGPDGSQLHSTFLAHPGTRVGYFNNRHLENHWWIAYACQELGLPLSILIGEITEERSDVTKSDYRIDIEVLPAFLDDLLSA
jgi:capsular polysaccharide biosynthesis protein